MTTNSNKSSGEHRTPAKASTMTLTNSELRQQIYKVFRELGVPSADSGGMEKPYVIDGADELLALIDKQVLEAEVRGASKAAEVINKEIGVEMTTNGEYYVNNIRLKDNLKEKGDE